MPTRNGEPHARHIKLAADVELQHPNMRVSPPGCELRPGASTGSFPVSSMPSGGVAADQCGRSSRRDPTSVLQLRPCDLHVRDGSGVFQTGPIPGGEARLGYWMKDGSPHFETGQNLALNKSYRQIVEGMGRGPFDDLCSHQRSHVSCDYACD